MNRALVDSLDMITTIGTGRGKITVHDAERERTGIIYINEGRVVSTKAPETQGGMEGFRTLLSWEGAQVQLHSLEDEVKETCKIDTAIILQELVRMENIEATVPNLRRAYFRLQSDHDLPEVIQVQEGYSFLGKWKGCDHVVNHPMISRIHCQIHFGDKGVIIDDLESSNGTYLNGVSIEKEMLHSGDTIRFGPVVYHLDFNG